MMYCMRQRRTDACTTAPVSGPPEGPNPKFSNNFWVQTQEGQGRRPIVCGHRAQTPASAAGGQGWADGCGWTFLPYQWARGRREIERMRR